MDAECASSGVTAPIAAGEVERDVDEHVSWPPIIPGGGLFEKGARIDVVAFGRDSAWRRKLE